MLRKIMIIVINNISCLKNKITNEDNSSNADSVLGLYNKKTLNILGQERNDFWSPPDYSFNSDERGIAQNSPCLPIC